MKENKVQKILYKNIDLNILDASLPTCDEISEMPFDLAKFHKMYWTKSIGAEMNAPGKKMKSVKLVGQAFGKVYFPDHLPFEWWPIRVVLTFKKTEDLLIGDRFIYRGYEFQVFSDTKAFSVDMMPSVHCFQDSKRAYKINDPENYDKSIIKTTIEKVFIK